jgi:hypothetical protein
VSVSFSRIVFATSVRAETEPTDKTAGNSDMTSLTGKTTPGVFGAPRERGPLRDGKPNLNRHAALPPANPLETEILRRKRSTEVGHRTEPSRRSRHLPDLA